MFVFVIAVLTSYVFSRVPSVGIFEHVSLQVSTCHAKSACAEGRGGRGSVPHVYLSWFDSSETASAGRLQERRATVHSTGPLFVGTVKYLRFDTVDSLRTM